MKDCWPDNVMEKELTAGYQEFIEISRKRLRISFQMLVPFQIILNSTERKENDKELIKERKESPDHMEKEVNCW